jgi:hypothetical protein
MLFAEQPTPLNVVVLPCSPEPSESWNMIKDRKRAIAEMDTALSIQT